MNSIGWQQNIIRYLFFWEMLFIEQKEIDSIDSDDKWEEYIEYLHCAYQNYFDFNWKMYIYMHTHTHLFMIIFMNRL